MPRQSNVLAIETSSPLLSVALKKAGGKIREARLKGFLTHAENLLPCIDKLLRAEKTAIGDIDTLLIGRGPGSFTGLRIGFASIKGFLASQIRDCYGALSLDLIAEGIRLPEGAGLCVCLDARRGKLYTKYYTRRNGAWAADQQARVSDFEEIMDTLPEGVAMTGDGLVKYGEDFKKYAGRKIIRFMPENAWYPKASCLIPWFESGDPRLAKLTEPADFLPLYFRLSEPEEKRRKCQPH